MPNGVCVCYSLAEIHEAVTAQKLFFQHGTTQKSARSRRICPDYAARCCYRANAACGIITLFAQKMKTIPISPRDEMSPTQRGLMIALLVWWTVHAIVTATTGRPYPFLLGAVGGMIMVAVFLFLHRLRARRFSLNWNGRDCELRVGSRVFFEGSVESMVAVRRTVRGYRLYPEVGRRFYRLRSADAPIDLKALLDKKHGEQDAPSNGG